MKKGKRILALCLVLCLLAGMVPPVAARAEETQNPVVKELRFYPDCESSAYEVISNAEEELDISFNTTLNPYKFEIQFAEPEAISHAWLSSTVDGTRKTLAAEYDEKTGLFVTEGYFDPEDRYYVPTDVRVEYSRRSNAPAVGSDVDWEVLMTFLAEELENAVVDNTNEGSDSYGTVDFNATVDELKNTALEYALDGLNDATGGVLDEVRSEYQSAANIISYVVEGVDNSRYQAYLDLSDPSNLKILLDDGLDVGSRAIELSMKFVDKSTNAYQTLEVVSDAMGHVGKTADVLKDLYDISQEMDGIREEIAASDDLTGDQLKSVTDAVDALERDQMLFVLLATALPIVATGGAATPAAAAIFTGMVGIISTASEAVYDHRIAGVKDEIALASFDSASYGNSSNGFWWNFNSGMLTVGGKGNLYNGAISDWYYYVGSKRYLLKNTEVTGLRIMPGITGVGAGALTPFYHAETVTFPESLETIGGGAFDGFYKLVGVTLPGELKTFHTKAFSNCKNLTSITIPDSVTTLLGEAFDDTYLKDVYYEGTIEQWEQIEGSAEVKDFTVSPDQWSTDGVRIHMQNNGSMGENIVWGFSEELGILTIGGEGGMPELVDHQYPWRHCGPWIKCVVIEDGVTYLSSSVFSNHKALEEVYLPTTLESAGTNTFLNCTALKTVKIPEGAEYVPSFSGCTALREVTIPDSVTYIGPDAFRRCTALETVNIGNGVKTIGSNAFSNCNALTSLKLPDSLKEIYGYAFSNSDNLTELTIPDSVTVIGNGAFSGHDGLKKITLPSGLSRIRMDTFSYCTALEEIAIPASVNQMEENCFAYCTSLKEITFLGDPPESIDGWEFEGVTANVHYPAGNLNWTGAVMAKFRRGTLTWDAPALKILTQPVSVTVENGTTASVTVEAEGDNPKYAWYYAEAGKDDFALDASTTGGEYSVTMSEAVNGRRVYCVLTDDRGDTVTSDTVTLKMIPTQVVITRQPQDVTVAEGERASVSFEAEGVDLYYCWYYKYPGSDTFYMTREFSGNSYSREMTAELSGWQVYCVVTDGYGNSAQTDTVTLYVEGAVPQVRARILKQPVSVTVADGEKATVTFEAEGDGLTYQWYYRNPGDSGFAKTSAFTANTYSVTMSAARNGRQVYCIVTDRYGNTARTNTVTLSMEKPAVVILKQPEDVTVASGEKATVTFEAAGNGLTYTWYYKNSGDSSFSKTTAFTSNTYEVTMSAARSGRQVYCIVTDQYGNGAATNIVTLSMETSAPVTIVTQPKSVWVPGGEQAVVTVEATGDGLTYQWYYKNPGATKYTYTSSFKGNTYSVTMNAERSGRYVYCKVTDAYGNTVKSKTVSVNMQTPLEIITQPKSVRVAEGATAKVTVKAQGDGLTYKWYYKNPGASSYSYTASFTGNSYSITMNESRDGRYVYCKVYDKYGNCLKTNTVSLRMK